MRTLLLLVVLGLVGCGSRISTRANYVLGTAQASMPGRPMIYVEVTKALPPTFNDTSVLSRQELVYAGHDGTTIFVLYREYKEDLIRDGYRQELVYDLSEGQSLWLGPWKIEVISATNQEIKFIVTDDEGLSTKSVPAQKNAKKQGSPRRAGG